jgi:hypothetical protein
MKKTSIIAAIGILCVIVPQIQASLIEIAIEAKIIEVSDDYSLLEGKINVDDIITGSYKYDSEAADNEPDYHYKGLYKFNQSPYGISLEAGGFQFKTDPTIVDFTIGIINDYPSLLNDIIGLDSDNNLTLDNGVPLRGIFWQLDDYSGQAISSISLPVTAPIIDDWQDGNILNIAGGVEREETFGISATVTSATLIPEPSSILLLSTGIIYLSKRYHL